MVKVITRCPSTASPRRSSDAPEAPIHPGASDADPLAMLAPAGTRSVPSSVSADLLDPAAHHHAHAAAVVAERSQGERPGSIRAHEQVGAVARGEDDARALLGVGQRLPVVAEQAEGVLVQHEVQEPGGAGIDDPPAFRAGLGQVDARAQLPVDEQQVALAPGHDLLLAHLSHLPVAGQGGVADHQHPFAYRRRLARRGDDDRAEQAAEHLLRDQPVVVGVVPERAGGVVVRDGVLVLGPLTRLHHAQDVVAAALRRHVEAVGVQVGGLAQVVGQGDTSTSPGATRSVGPGLVPL